MSEITRSRVYPVPAETLWRLVATPDGLSSWLMPTDLEAVEGARFTMQADPGPGFDGTVRGEVIEVIPQHRLRFSWIGGPLDTEVTFTLTALDANRTRLDLEHRGFDGLRARLVRTLLGIGWRRLLRRSLPAAADDLDARSRPEEH